MGAVVRVVDGEATMQARVWSVWE